MQNAYSFVHNKLCALWTLQSMLAMFHWHFVWRLTLTNKNKKKIETFQNVQKFACGIHANITYLLRNIIGYPNKNIKLFVRYHCSTVVENGGGRRKGANAVNESKTGNRLPNVSWVLKHATIQRRLNELFTMELIQAWTTPPESQSITCSTFSLRLIFLFCMMILFSSLFFNDSESVAHGPFC